jgi:alpha-1,6-mannosyltransferase
MQILLIDSVPLTFGGGYESFLFDLTKEARARGHEVTLITPTVGIARTVGRPAGIKMRVRLSPYEVHRKLDGATLVTGGLLTLRRVLESRDIAYVKNEPHEVLAALTMARRRTPVVVGFHSAIHGRPGLTGRMRSAVYNSTPYRFLLKRSDAFHTLQPAQTHWLVEKHHLSKDKVHCVPNGVDLHRFRPGKHQHNDIFKLLFAGRLDAQKGIDTLLDAFAMLDSLALRASLTVAGDGPLRGLVQRAEERSGMVSYVGHTSDMLGLVSQHDLVIAPSRWEVFPLVPAEAMACGVPVIASLIPENEVYANAEAVELCPPDNPLALAETIVRRVEEFRRSPERFAKLRRDARRFAEQELDLTRAMGTLLDVMEGLVAA